MSSVAVRNAIRPPMQKPIGVQLANAAALGRAQVRRRGPDVGRQAVPGELHDVGLVLERRATSTQTRRPPEVVDRDRIDPVLRELEREVLVVRVESADIGQHDHPDAQRFCGERAERREVRPVRRPQRQLAAVQRPALDRRDGRSGVMVEAHGGPPSRRGRVCPIVPRPARSRGRARRGYSID